MIRLNKNQEAKLKWTILKGVSNELEDFTGCEPVLYLLSEDNKTPLTVESHDDGIVVATIPALVDDGVYGFKLIWTKGGTGRYTMAKESKVYYINGETDPSLVNPVIKIKSHVQTYGYDGLSSYELACLKGMTQLSENEWLANLAEINERAAEIAADEDARARAEAHRVANENERKETQKSLEEQIAEVQQSRNDIDMMLHGGSDRRDMTLRYTHYATDEIHHDATFEFETLTGKRPQDEGRFIKGLDWSNSKTISLMYEGAMRQFEAIIDRKGATTPVKDGKYDIGLWLNGGQIGVLATTPNGGYEVDIVGDGTAFQLYAKCLTESAYEYRAKFADDSLAYLTSVIKLNDGDLVIPQDVNGHLLYKLVDSDKLSSGVELESVDITKPVQAGYYCLWSATGRWDYDKVLNVKVINTEAKGVYEYLEYLDEGLKQEETERKNADADLQNQIDNITIVKEAVASSDVVLDKWQMRDRSGKAIGAPIVTYKDQFIKNIEIVHKSDTGKDYMRITYSKEGIKDSFVEFDISSLLHDAEFKEGLQVKAGKVSVKLSKDSVSSKYLKIAADGSIEISGIETYMDQVENERQATFERNEGLSSSFGGSSRWGIFNAAEATRNTNETARISAEQARNSQESIRQGKENERNSNEKVRQDKETERQQAEGQRAQTFTQSQTQRQNTFVASEQSRATAFAASQAEKQAVFDSKEAERDAAIASVTEFEQKVNNIDKAIGLYSKALPITLNHSVATNRILTTLPSGEVTQVEKTGWNISRINAEEFTFGDTAFLKMLSAGGQNLMVEGAVLFASEEEIKDKDGNVISTRLTSLFRASNTDIPESGFVVKTLSLKGKNLLVSHPAEITELVMGRSGVGASMATLEGNLQNEIDEKANLSGFHGAMITGGAISLVPEKAEDSMPAYTENLPAARMVGDAGALTDQTWATSVYPNMPHDPDNAKGKRSSLSIERVEGECLGVNQMVKNINFPQMLISGIMYKKIGDNTISCVGTSTERAHTQVGYLPGVRVKTGDKLLVMPMITGNIHSLVILEKNESVSYLRHGNYSKESIMTIGANTTMISEEVQAAGDAGKTIDGTINPSVLNVTALFPTPSGQAFVSKLTNNQSSALAVCNKLGYASVITYDE